MFSSFCQLFFKSVPRELCEAWAVSEQHRLMNYARAYAGSAQDVELVVSRALHSVERALYAGKVEKEALLPYAYQAIRNEAVTLYRKEARRRRAEQGYLRASEDELIHSPHHEAPPPEDIDIRLIMQELPDELAEILRLHIWEGLSFASMADTLGLSETTVRRRYQQAISAIRSKLNP